MPIPRALRSGRGEFPLAGAGGEGIGMGGPVVKGCGVEVRAVGPDKGMHFRVDSDLIEKLKLAQRPEEFPGENRAKIDYLLRVVVEPHTQSVIPCDFK